MIDMHQRAGGANRVYWSASDWDSLPAREKTLIASREQPPGRRAPTIASMPAPQLRSSGALDEFTGPISIEVPDCYGDLVRQSGWKTDEFLRNPVILLSHDSHDFPIGRATRVWLADGKLMATMQLAPADLNPVAGQAAGLMRAGYLRGASVGFRPLKWAFSKDKAREGSIDFYEQVLCEFSVVAIPACPGCYLQPAPGATTGKSLPALPSMTPRLDEARRHVEATRPPAAGSLSVADAKRRLAELKL